MLSLMRRVFALMFIVGGGRWANAQIVDMNCMLSFDDRSPQLDQPWMHPELDCLKLAVADPVGREMSFAALTFADDDTLYSARPETGEIFHIVDSDGDGITDAPQVILENLDFPRALAWHSDILFIAERDQISAWDGISLQPIITDIDVRGGFGFGALEVVDDRLYVAVGAPCDACEYDLETRGIIFSTTLTGEDYQLVAQGLRAPLAMQIVGDQLYVVDSAPLDASALITEPRFLDEINRIDLNQQSPVNFGYPTCMGQSIVRYNGDCSAYTAPYISLPAGSLPMGLAYTTSDVFPNLQNHFIVTLAGMPNSFDLRGYSVVSIDPQNPAQIETIIPYNFSSNQDYSPQDLSYRDSSFFPRRPFDLAVDSLGRVYIAVTGGQVLAIYPAYDRVQ